MATPLNRTRLDFDPFAAQAEPPAANRTRLDFDPFDPPPGPRGAIGEVGAALGRGLIGTAEMFARAGRVLGLDTTDIIEATKSAAEPLEATKEGEFWRSVNQGLESSVQSVLGGLPGVTLGAVAGPAGAIAGFAGSAGVLFSLREYDEFLENVENLGLRRDDFKDEALISAIAEGGIEAITDVLAARIFKIGQASASGAAKAGMAAAFKKLTGRTLKLGAVEVPGEAVTAAIQARQVNVPRIEAGLEPLVPSEQAVSSIGPTLVQTALLGPLAGGVRAATRRAPEVEPGAVPEPPTAEEALIEGRVPTGEVEITQIIEEIPDTPTDQLEQTLAAIPETDPLRQPISEELETRKAGTAQEKLEREGLATLALPPGPSAVIQLPDEPIQDIEQRQTAAEEFLIRGRQETRRREEELPVVQRQPVEPRILPQPEGIPTRPLALPPGQGFTTEGEPTGPKPVEPGKRPEDIRAARRAARGPQIRGKIPADLVEAFDIMKDQVAQGQVERGAPGEGIMAKGHIIGSTFPAWFRGKGYSKEGFNAVLRRAEAGEKLTDRQAELFQEFTEIARDLKKTDPDLVAAEDTLDLQRRGFEPVAGETKVADLNEGDKFIIGTEEFELKEFDDEGNAIIEDGRVIKVDIFDTIKIDGIKPGEITDAERTARGLEGRGEREGIERPEVGPVRVRDNGKPKEAPGEEGAPVEPRVTQPGEEAVQLEPEEAAPDKDSFTLERFVEGEARDVTFSRGEDVKVVIAGETHAGPITSISHAKKEFRIASVAASLKFAHAQKIEAEPVKPPVSVPEEKVAPGEGVGVTEVTEVTEKPSLTKRIQGLQKGRTKKEKALQRYNTFIDSLSQAERVRAGSLIVSSPESPSLQERKIFQAISAPQPSKISQKAAPITEPEAVQGVTKQKQAVNKLRVIGQRTLDRAQEKHDQERNENTPRRAAMGASARADAAADIAIAQTMLKIADGLEAGELTALGEVSAKAQVQTLDSILRAAQRKKYKDYSEQQRKQGEPVVIEDVERAEYPDITLHPNLANNIRNDIRAIRGGKQLMDGMNVVRMSFGDAKKVLDFAKKHGISKSLPWNLEEDFKTISRLRTLGFTNLSELKEGLKELVNVRAGAKKEDPIKAMERELIGTKIAGFFPTRKPVVDKMLNEAGIEKGMTVLEPSAGMGNIAEGIKAEGFEPDVIEISDTLRQLLDAKGFNIIDNDFLAFDGKYDRIIMNPPFEKGQDVDHVRHAFALLNPGGRVVSIMSEHAFFASDKKSQEFRDWLDENGGISEQLPAGAFKGKDALRETGVSSRLVIIDATGETAPTIDVEAARKRVSDSITSQRGSFSLQGTAGQATFNDLLTVGRDIYNQGSTSLADFSARLKTALGTAWERIKHIVRRLWGSVRVVIANERGELGDKVPKLNPLMQKYVDQFVEAQPVAAKDVSKPEQKTAIKDVDAGMSNITAADQKGPNFQDTKGPVTQKDRDDNWKSTRSVTGKAVRNIKRFASEIAEGTDKYLGAISTRLGNISLKLKAKIRRLDFDINKKHTADKLAILPLLEKAKKMTPRDATDWDYARKNSDTFDIDRLVKKYNLELEWKRARATLDRLREEGIDVGMDIGQIDVYWPRILDDSRGFLTAIGKDPQWPIYTRKIEERAVELGIDPSKMTTDMKADIIVNTMMGGGTGLGGISATKSRKLEKIPAALNQYYLNSDAAVLQHLYDMRKGIELRKFLGKIPKKVAEIRKRLHATQARIRGFNERMDAATFVKTVEGKKVTLPMTDKERDRLRKNRNRNIGLEKGYEAYIAQYAIQRDYTENIGQYTLELIINGEVNAGEERILNDILNARFHEQGTRGIVQAYKNISYIDTMGSPISALTQIGDLAWSAYDSGLVATLKNAAKAFVGKSRIKKEDVGIERIAQEFANSGTLANAVAKVFKFVGLEKIDSIGKEALLNSSLERFQKQAKKDPAGLRKEILPIFEGETDETIQSLIDGEITDNVKLLVYNRLLDFQPVALSEMPQKYLDAGNGRIFYMLKTFTLKQFDAFRNEAYNKIKSGDRKQAIQGLKNLVSLGMWFVLANAGADELKDFFLNRKTDFRDRVTDNLLRLAGISKFVTWKARTEGVGSALSRQILPPFKFVDSLGKDIINAGDDKGVEMLGSIPFVGKLAYWHFGRGTTKRQDLWDRRLRKEKDRLRKVTERFERADNRSSFRAKHDKDLRRNNRVKGLQGRLNQKRATINRLKKQPSTPEMDKRIQRLEDQRIEMIKSFLGEKS